MDVAVCGRIFLFLSDALIAGYAGVGTLGSVVMRASRRRRIACLVTVFRASVSTLSRAIILERIEGNYSTWVRSLQWRTCAISVYSTVVVCGGRVVRRYAMSWLLEDKFAELQ